MSAATGIFSPILAAGNSVSLQPGCRRRAARWRRPRPGLRDPADTGLAFFGAGFTALSEPEMTACLEAGAALVNRCGLRGIRPRIRPDASGPAACTQLSASHDAGAGVRGMGDRVLARAGRGHTVRQVREGAGRIRGIGFAGAADDDRPAGRRRRRAEAAWALLALRPDGLRVYPAMVLRGSAPKQDCRAGPIPPADARQAVSPCALLSAHCEAAGVPIVKMGLHAEPDFERGAPPRRRAGQAGGHRGRRLVLPAAPGRAFGMAGPGGINRRRLPGQTGAAGLSVRERAGLAPFEVQIEVEPR